MVDGVQKDEWDERAVASGVFAVSCAIDVHAVSLGFQFIRPMQSYTPTRTNPVDYCPITFFSMICPHTHI